MTEEWVDVAGSADVTGRKPLPLRCGGRELVCYRGASGQLHVIDGRCPHMGVRFSREGIIEGEGICCRFHGWVWDGEGRNVRVMPQRRRFALFDLCSYPVREVDGRVLVRLQADGGAGQERLPGSLGPGSSETRQPR